ncbi:hypothetical protein GCM10007939_19630 [Amylibacter marinus]|uniref:Tellurite resistance TerB family protein n=1 Tax=Amylibacter marinus TaxID=1475483 RepID=A0ABQ5VWN8_9RHOB|nr:DUF533 domain-containing protein [Amylibacter marinus]GLQ35680.1 hypothetical protein GCM10007939_19630 [Amylibacter marinus]
MSLVSTLAKVAIGVAVAKGVKSVAGGKSSSGGGLGDLLGGALGGGSGGSGGLGDLLGGALKGGGSGNAGGMGDLLGGLMGGGASKSAAPGGLGDLMGGLLKGGAGGASGGLGDILGQLGGAGAAGGLGGLLTNALENKGQLTQPSTQEDEDAAALMIRAMIQSAKSDGSIDEAEKDKLLNNLGELDRDEMAMIDAEVARSVDPKSLARATPRGMEAQVYMMSVMGIDLDTQDEASYLHDLGQALNLERSKMNEVHEMLGAQPLYR